MTQIKPRLIDEETTHITLGIVCPLCGEESHVRVSKEGMRAWNEGTHIQHAFPHNSADDRELLLSGICPKCWKDVFASDEEE